MRLSRTYNWGLIFPWFMPRKNVFINFNNGRRYISHIPVFDVRPHDILTTDYDNYAVQYSCQNILFGLFHYQQATLLSRSKHVKRQYMNKVKQALDSVDYNYEWWWGWQVNNSCLYSYEDTDEDLFLQLLENPPTWSNYRQQTYNTQRFVDVYDKSD